MGKIDSWNRVGNKYGIELAKQESTFQPMPTAAILFGNVLNKRGARRINSATELISHKDSIPGNRCLCCNF